MPKVLTTPRSGKQGTSVSFKSPYGQAERQLTLPRNPRTPAQQRVRAVLAYLAARWRSLTDTQRAAWQALAHKTHSRPRLGQSGRLTGCQLYLKINCTLAAIGAPYMDDPPERPNFGDNPVGALNITNQAETTTLKLKVSRAPVCPIMVMGTAPCSAGRSRPRRFTLLGVLPTPVAGVTEVTDLYVAKYGVPPAGTRVFIRTRQVINGWEDEPRDTTALVPSP